MLAQFFSTLTNRDKIPDPDPDERLALAALLVRLARADDDYQESERDQIGRILAERYALDEEQSNRLREEAEQFESDAPDTVRFTRAIKDAVPYEARLGIIETLWQVALADGERGAHEDALIRLSSNLLGISDRDSALTRQKVSRAP